MLQKSHLSLVIHRKKRRAMVQTHRPASQRYRESKSQSSLELENRARESVRRRAKAAGVDNVGRRPGRDQRCQVQSVEDVEDISANIELHEFPESKLFSESHVPGAYTPVLAKHSKNFSLEDSLAIGVDRMQRNFGPLKQQVEE
jgi:hypothetical protein